MNLDSGHSRSMGLTLTTSSGVFLKGEPSREIRQSTMVMLVTHKKNKKSTENCFVINWWPHYSHSITCPLRGSNCHIVVFSQSKAVAWRNHGIDQLIKPMKEKCAIGQVRCHQIVHRSSKKNPEVFVSSLWWLKFFLQSSLQISGSIRACKSFDPKFQLLVPKFWLFKVTTLTLNLKFQLKFWP